MQNRTIFLREGQGMHGLEILDWMVVTDLLRGNCALINNGMGRERINRSDVMLNTASSIRWL